MTRREFLQILAAAAAAGLPIESRAALDLSAGASFYDAIERFGNVSLLHFTDCHAQLRPIHFREPSVNLGVGDAAGRPPHLVGEAFLRHFGVAPGTREAHAFTFLDFANAAKAYGATGGFAHLATLVKKLEASRPGALLLDGGDTWQGSATALWTNGQDMVDAQKLLGVDVMTAHWEFTLGAERVKAIVERDFAGKVDFVAQNVKTSDFGDPVFPPCVIRTVNGVPVAIVGQAFPYTPIANPRYFVPEEGAILWVTSAAIPADAPDPELSTSLLRELMDPRLAAGTTERNGYATPNREARRLLPPALDRDSSLFPDEETLKRCVTLTAQGEAEARLSEEWKTLTGAVT